MNIQVPFPRLVYGVRDFFSSLVRGFKRHPMGGTLSILGLVTLVGLRNGYLEGYFLSLQQQALSGATLTMVEIHHLENQDSTSLHFSLDVELDGRIQSIFYTSDEILAQPWYMGWKSKTQLEKSRKVYADVLSEVAMYRCAHPTEVVSEGSYTYKRLLDHLPDEASSHMSDTKP